MSDFSNFKLGRSIQRGIEAAAFVEPRPIQTQTIPAALAGRDILGLAHTGTGKTAAFALPLLERLLAARRPGLRGLVVAPTRELVRQISEEICTLARFTTIEVASIFGGVSQHRQVQALRKKPQVVVACPGRLLDLMQQQALHLSQVEMLVLDEADHMFDMGFLPDLRRILAALPAQRQNLLFSATMPREIRRLADGLLNDPTVVDLAQSRPVATVAHALYPVEETHKFGLLEHVLASQRVKYAIVFTRTKHRAKRLAQQLDRSGHRAVALQGNMSQPQRERAMQGFRKHDFDILVATDIAARGIDVACVSHVVNFDMPGTIDAYTHRIGRTGRSERHGTAYTFVTAADQSLVRAVERRLGSSIPVERWSAPRRRATPERSDANPTYPRAPRRHRRHAQPRNRGTGSPAGAARGPRRQA